MRVFAAAAARLHGLNAYLRDNEVKTPRNLLDERNPRVETRKAFDHSLDSVEGANSDASRVRELDDGVSDDELSDAKVGVCL